MQSSVPPERLLPTELTAEGQPQGQTDLGGLTWQRYTARGNEQALVLLEPDRTVIVIGDARDTELPTAGRGDPLAGSAAAPQTSGGSATLPRPTARRPWLVGCFPFREERQL